MNIHRYFPHTREDIDIMLKRCGVDKAEDLYADVPAELLLDHRYNASRGNERERGARLL